MDCAIDKESVIAVALNGMGTAIYSQAPNNMPGASEENVNSFDAEQAKKYMDESGVDPASIEMSIICSNDTKKRAAEVIQANLKDTLGINATIDLSSLMGSSDSMYYGGGMYMSDSGSGTVMSIIPIWLVLAAIGFAVVVGLLSGIVPASRAVRISALEAIRHD